MLFELAFDSLFHKETLCANMKLDTFFRLRFYSGFLLKLILLQHTKQTKQKMNYFTLCGTLFSLFDDYFLETKFRLTVHVPGFAHPASPSNLS